MRRLLAGIVVIAVIGVVIEGHGSSAASPGRARTAVSRIAVTPRLKRVLRAEITTLRAGQPTAPRTVAPRAHSLTVVPEQGVPCFVTGGSSRCSEIPCGIFASAPAVYRLGSTAVARPGTVRKPVAPASACPRHAMPERVLVSRP